MGKWMLAFLGLLGMVTLAACGEQAAVPAITVDGPALVMFYTDG